jgi:hypothetical protein
MKTSFKHFIYSFFLILWMASSTLAQDSSTVNVKGIGVSREDAIQDALRQAVGQAVGVMLTSETKVENFMVLEDAIKTKTQGYISSYEIVKETPQRNNVEVMIKAVVSLKSLKADVNYLAQSIGGIRFLVSFDPRKLSPNEIEVYNQATERINNYLSSKKYRYIERSRVESLRREASLIMQEIDSSPLSYVQQLGLLSDAQFIILIDKINTDTRKESFDTRTSSKVIIDVKAYDNCTAEGLGTVVLESDWNTAADANQSLRNGVTEAVNKELDKLLTVFNSYIGDWVNNGTPFELRFYASGTFRDMRDLRERLKADKNFGGQFEMINVNNYTKINCTFRKKPDELADRVLDISDMVPSLASKKMDVKFIYGRQISFAPQEFVVPDVQSIAIARQNLPKEEPIEVTKVETEKENVTKTENITAEEKAAPEVRKNTGSIVSIFSNNGEKFWVVINGVRQNEVAQSNVTMENIHDDVVLAKIFFQNEKLPSLNQRIGTKDLNGNHTKISYVITKNKKGKYVTRINSAETITELTSKTTTETNNNESLNLDSRNQQKATEKRDCAAAMEESDFNSAKNSIKNEFYSSSQMEMAKHIARNFCFNTSQVIEIANIFSYEQQKLEFAKLAYDITIDKQNYFKVNEIFGFSTSKTDLLNYINSRK